jgi:hypothetical protein
MRISHVNLKEQINFIEVRQYENSIVNFSQTTKPIKSDFNVGVWKVKRIIKVPKEYKNDYVFEKN